MDYTTALNRYAMNPPQPQKHIVNGHVSGWWFKGIDGNIFPDTFKTKRMCQEWIEKNSSEILKSLQGESL